MSAALNCCKPFVFTHFSFIKIIPRIDLRVLFLLCYFPVFGILIYVLVLPLQHSLVLPSPPMLCKIVRALECGVVAQHSDCF